MKNTQQWWKQFAESKEQLALEIKNLLDNDWSMPRIAKKYNISSTAIHNLIKKYNLGGRRQNLRSKEWLYNEYVINKKSMNEIAKELGVTPQAIDSYLTKFEIPKRKITEIQKIASKRYRSQSGKLFPMQVKSFGYMISYGDLWFASAAEFTYFLILKSKGIQFVFQKYLLQKRPDFILNEKMVIEIKHGDLSAKEVSSYAEYAKALKQSLNLSYKIIYVDRAYPKEHKKICQFLKSRGGERGNTIVTLQDDDIDYLIKMVSY